MAAASSFDSIITSNANANDSMDMTTMADIDNISRSISPVAVAETVPSNDATSQRSVGSRPTPLPSNNNGSRSSPRRHITVTCTSSPLRKKKKKKKKNTVIDSRSSKKSSKKQPLGKMWIRHVPMALKPRSNYYQPRDNSRKDEQPSLLHHQNHQLQPQGDSTDSYLSTVFLLSSPINDHGSWTFLSPHPPANSHSVQQPQPQPQPKYFYRRPHSLRSPITTVHAFGESGKPLSSSLTSSSSPSSSPKSSPISSPSNHATLPLWTDPFYSCYNHHNVHDDSLVHSFSSHSSKHGVFAPETNGFGDHHANAHVHADDGGYYDNYVFPDKDAAPVVKLMGC